MSTGSGKGGGGKEGGSQRDDQPRRLNLRSSGVRRASDPAPPREFDVPVGGADEGRRSIDVPVGGADEGRRSIDVPVGGEGTVKVLSANSGENYDLNGASEDISSGFPAGANVNAERESEEVEIDESAPVKTVSEEVKRSNGVSVVGENARGSDRVDEAGGQLDGDDDDEEASLGLTDSKERASMNASGTSAASDMFQMSRNGNVENMDETASGMMEPDESKVSIKVEAASNSSSEGASNNEENAGIFRPSEPAEDGDGADEDVMYGGNYDESGGNYDESGGYYDESSANDVSGTKVAFNDVETEGISSEETELMSEERESLDDKQNIDLNADDDDNTGERSQEEEDSEDYTGETFQEDSEESGGSPKQSGGSADAISGWESNISPPQHQSNSPSLRQSSSSNAPPARQPSAEGQKMSAERIEGAFRPTRPEGRRDDGEYEEEIEKRKEAPPQSREGSRAPSESGSIRSDRLTAIGNDAMFPPKKEMAAGDKPEQKIPGPPNDEDPYIPIHPLLANYLPAAWFKELKSLDDCACKTPLYNAIYQLANVIRAKTGEIKQMDIKNDSLKQTNSKIIAELRKWSQASSFFEQSQIKLEAELHKTNLQRDDLKKKLEGQTILLDKFREQLKDKQAEISTEHVAFGDLERELEFTQREVILRDQNIEKLQERISTVERERAVEAEKRRQASSRVTDLETEMVALESKHAKSNTLNEAIAAKQKAEASSRIASENLNALQQEYQRLIHTTKNDGDYNTELVSKINKLMAKNESLEKELGQLRCEANCQIISLNKDKNKINSEHQKMIRERVHLDSTIADLKASNGLMKQEREASKSDLAIVRSKLDEAMAEKKDERIRSNVVVTKLGEEMKALKMKLLDLESKAGNEDVLKQMLANKGKELAHLQTQTDEKLSLLTSSMKCSTENLHAQIEALKAALLRKAEELQRLKYEHGDTIELEPIGISFKKEINGTITLVEGPGVSREAELKNVINEMTKQLEVVRKDNKRLKDLLKSTEDECDCLQNCFKENTRLEKDVENYQLIIKEMMSQSKSLTRTAMEMGFNIPGHSSRDSFIRDKETIKRNLIGGGGRGAASGNPSRKSSRFGVASGATTATPSRGEPASGPPSRPGGASQSSLGDNDDGGASEGDGMTVVDENLVKLDDAVYAAMTARDNQLRSVLRGNMEEMGLDDTSILNIEEFQEQNIDYVTELETVFNRAKELADLAEEYRLRAVKLENEYVKTQAELDHYKELELALIEKGLIDGDYLQKLKADVIDVLKPEPEQIVDMNHFLEEQQEMLREKVAKECSSRSDLVEALKNQFLNEAKELHDELELLRQKLIEKEKELQEKGFQRSGYLDQEAKWRDEMPPPADAVGYRDSEGAWREASPPPQEPGYFDAGGAWKDETPDPNVAGYVDDGGSFVQAPLVEPPLVEPPLVEPPPDDSWRRSGGAVETVGGVVVDGGGGGGEVPVPDLQENAGDGGGGGNSVSSGGGGGGGEGAGGNAEAANDRESAASGVRVDRDQPSHGTGHVSFVGESPMARESAASLPGAESAKVSAARVSAPEDIADRKKSEMNEEEVQQLPTSNGSLHVVGGIAMVEKCDIFEEKERRISALLKKSAELNALADHKEKKEIAEAEVAQRWSTQVLQKRLRGAYNCFMSYWENLGGIIPDCNNECEHGPTDKGGQDPTDQLKEPSLNTRKTGNENENRLRRHGRRRKSGDRKRSSSRRCSGSRPRSANQNHSSSRRRSPSGQRSSSHQRSESRSTRHSSPGRMSSSPHKRRQSDDSYFRKQLRHQSVLPLQQQQQQQRKFMRRPKQPDHRNRRDRTLTPNRGDNDDLISLTTVTSLSTMLDSDDGIMMTASRRELRERARNPTKRKAYLKDKIDARLKSRSDDSDSSGMAGKRGYSRI